MTNAQPQPQDEIDMVGLGVEGRNEEGGSHGPSIMPDGQKETYERIDARARFTRSGRGSENHERE